MSSDLASRHHRVSLVTGAGSGIGAATAAMLAARGDAVVCADMDLDSATSTASLFPNALAVEVDVSSAEAVARMIDLTVQRFGRLDVVVPCAEISVRGDAHQLPSVEFLQIIEMNLKGTFLTATAGARVMRDAGIHGAVVLVGSIHSLRALRGQAAYAASKGGVLMLGKVLALEWARFGIRVNTIGPGFSEASATEMTGADPERLAAWMRRIPLGRAAQPDDIAKAIAFLASEDATYITGAYLNVDGGWLAA